MKGQFYKEKRHKLLEKVKDNSVIVLFAGNAPKKTADEAYPFTAYEVAMMGRYRKMGIFSRPSNQDKDIIMDAFEKTGSDLSFSLALLNSKKNTE